jgi:hypothetical protein
MENSTIVIRGAREHNLRNVNLELPRNQLIVFTGVSGSGKSSLAFDTLPYCWSCPLVALGSSPRCEAGTPGRCLSHARRRPFRLPGRRRRVLISAW